MRDYPSILTPANHVEPVPRRIRAVIGSTTVVDTVAAIYVWERPNYPAYYIPIADVREAVLVGQGPDTVRDIEVEGRVLSGAAHVASGGDADEAAGYVRFDWQAMDAWYEEDEQVFVHPRDPYTRVDALRSTRHVIVSVDGIVLAETHSPVIVFETGLPSRYYLNPTDVDFTHLEATLTETACPYKGSTCGYWSARTPVRTHRDIAWRYAFPTRQLLPIAGMIAFYNERTDITVDGVVLDRPRTHFA